MGKVRSAPSPTGSLHLGSALSAVANRRFAEEHGGTMLLRIDDTDAARNVEGGADAIVADLEWLRGGWGWAGARGGYARATGPPATARPRRRSANGTPRERFDSGERRSCVR